MLTKSSWDPGQLTSTRRVAARGQLPRGDTPERALPLSHGKPSGSDGGRDKTHCTWGECTRQAPGHLSCSDLGKAQNAGPTESVTLWSTGEPEPEWLSPEKCMQPRAHFRQVACRATWSLSSVGQESTHAVSRANPVWPRHCEHATHASDVCSDPPSPQHN